LGSDDLSPELTIIRDRIALSMEPGMFFCWKIFKRNITLPALNP
jgi:hypothetical protein